METLWQDLRYAFRTLGRNPGFTIISAITLAIGIGATTAIFSVADHVVMRPLPYRDADQVVTLWETDRVTGEQHKEVAPGNFLAWQERAAGFEAMGLAEPTGVDLTGDGVPISVASWHVTENFFEALGVPPIPGVGFGRRSAPWA